MNALDERRADEAADRLDRTFPVAVALAGALQVLTALESTASHVEPDGMRTGEGYAAGHALADDSLPNFAQHLRELVEQMHADSEVVRAVERLEHGLGPATT